MASPKQIISISLRNVLIQSTEGKCIVPDHVSLVGVHILKSEIGDHAGGKGKTIAKGTFCVYIHL